MSIIYIIHHHLELNNENDAGRALSLVIPHITYYHYYCSQDSPHYYQLLFSPFSKELVDTLLLPLNFFRYSKNKLKCLPHILK